MSNSDLSKISDSNLSKFSFKTLAAGVQYIVNTWAAGVLYICYDLGYQDTIYSLTPWLLGTIYSLAPWLLGQGVNTYWLTPWLLITLQEPGYDIFVL